MSFMKCVSSEHSGQFYRSQVHIHIFRAMIYLFIFGQSDPSTLTGEGHQLYYRWTSGKDIREQNINATGFENIGIEGKYKL